MEIGISPSIPSADQEASPSSNNQAQAPEPETPAAPAADGDNRVDLVVDDPLQKIAESKASTMRHQFWSKEEEVAQFRTERKEQALNSTKNEIYQLLGLYFAFQGLIFTAIVQANHLNKHILWIPLALSVVASVSATYVLWFKLADCAELQKHIKHERQKARTMWRKCDKLRNNIPYQQIESEERQGVAEAASDKKKNAYRDLWDSHMGLYGAGLLLIVLIVSGIMATACVLVLKNVSDKRPSNSAR